MAEEFDLIMKRQHRHINQKDFNITIGKVNDQFAKGRAKKVHISHEQLLLLMNGINEDLNNKALIRQ